jgi:bacterioferritin-associated ferredoxin
MYVCVCRGITDRQVETAIDEGADTREKVTATCGAGGGCGGCHDMIEGMIDERACGRRCLTIVRDRAA